MANRRYHPVLTPEAHAEELIEYQRCKALRIHKWDPIPVTKAPSFGVALDLRCESCGTVRREIVSRVTGQRLARPYYYHPDGYREMEQHNTEWWRSAWLASLYDQDHSLLNIENEAAPMEVTDIATKRKRRAS